MSDAPERIWANCNAKIVVTDLYRHETDVEYIRADIHAAEIAALQARNAALVEALRVADVEILENVRAFERVASDMRAAIEAARGE